ncbi:MAG: hypothetical protein QXE76_07235, partial [Candidatus Bathyarchaeia archaeon]
MAKNKHLLMIFLSSVVFPSTFISSLLTTSCIATLIPTNPFPLHDEFTENANAEPRTPYLYIEVPNYGTWTDNWLTLGNRVGTDDQKKYANDVSIVDEVTATGVGNPAWVPHHLFFVFEQPIDVTQWHFIKFYEALGNGNSGYCQFGFFTGPIGHEKYAYVSYSLPTNGMFYQQCFDIWEGQWTVEQGFDWHYVYGFAFWASTLCGPTDMWIDFPLLYSPQTPPPGGLIDMDELIGDRLGLFAMLYHCAEESIPDYDFYAVEVKIQDLLGAGANFEYPSYAKIHIETNALAEERPPNHEPHAGDYGEVQLPIDFSIYGVGFSLRLPAQHVKYNTRYENNKFIIEWDVARGYLVGPGGKGLIIFYDYASFWVMLRVPEGFKLQAMIFAEVVWYKYVREGYVEGHRESLYWAVVDPGGCEQITPTVPETLNTPEIIILPPLSERCLDLVTLRGGMGINVNSPSFKSSIKIFAFAFDNNQSVRWKDVGMEVWKNGVLVAKLTARTGEFGEPAIFEFQLDEVGILWTLVGSCDIRCVVVLDTMYFLSGFGDINGDLRVDMKDIAIVAKAFGS